MRPTSTKYRKNDNDTYLLAASAAFGDGGGKWKQIAGMRP